MTPKSSGWAIAAVSMLGLVLSMALRVYLGRAYTESPLLEAFKSFLFGGHSVEGEPVIQAPPIIDMSYANTLLGWAAFSGIIATGVLAHASLTWRERGRTQPQAVAIIVSLLTLYCLWGIWPWLEELFRR